MITLEQVLRENEQMNKIMGIELDLIPFPIIVITSIIMFIFVSHASYKLVDQPILASLISIVGILVGAIGFVLALVVIPIADAKNTQEWKENYAYPYIEQLEKQTKEIEQLNLGFSKEKDDEILEITYTEGMTHSKNLIPVEVIYSEEGEAKMLKTKAKIEYDLKENEKPYMEYIYLEEELPSLIEEGYFNLIIHTNK